MSITKTNYLMLCVQLPVEGFNWLDFQDEINGAPNRRFDIVCDSNRYLLAGHVIARSIEYEESLITINPEDLDIDQEALAIKISEAFDVAISSDDFKIIFFTHFS